MLTPHSSNLGRLHLERIVQKSSEELDTHLPYSPHHTCVVCAAADRPLAGTGAVFLSSVLSVSCVFITRYYKPGSLNNITVFLTVLEARKFGVNVLSNLVPYEGPLPGYVLICC